MRATDILSARALLSEYCEFFDSVLEKMEFDFSPAGSSIKLNLIARKSGGLAWRVIVSFENISSSRFDFDEIKKVAVLTEGIRLGSTKGVLAFDFDDSTLGAHYGESEWDMPTSRWLICETIDVQDVSVYQPKPSGG